ncbi:MAG: uracil-DNA glycosylase [Victivallaceae bacterium]|nr:uracil-DNA glycosylase [Victivallaceae bacterium]
MAKPDIFDEIITYLKNSSQADSGRTTISPELCQQFFTDRPHPRVQQPTNQCPPSRTTTNKPPRQSSTQMLAATVNETPQRQKTAPLPDLNQYDLQTLNQLVTACTRCPLCEHRTNVVFGDGNSNADLMFIGEGPGYHEDMQGIPFVGDAGNLLTKMITAMKYSRTEVYITNIVKCRPPNNRNPHDDEAACCLPYLNRQLELIKPKAIVLLGAIPLKYLLNRTGINKNRGQWFEYQGIPVIATFHPAYLLRYNTAKRDAWNDLQMVMNKLEVRS